MLIQLSHVLYISYKHHYYQEYSGIIISRVISWKDRWKGFRGFNFCQIATFLQHVLQAILNLWVYMLAVHA